MAQGRPGMPTSVRAGGLMDAALKEPVRKELGIENDAEKIAAIRKLSEDMRIDLRKGSRSLRGKDRQKIYEIASQLQTKYNVELKKLLSPQQFARLQEINRQLSGVRALWEPEVVQALGITHEQQDMLSELNFEAFKKRVKLLNPGGGRVDPNSKEIREKIQAIGTERQKKDQSNSYEDPAGKTHSTEREAVRFGIAPVEADAAQAMSAQHLTVLDEKLHV
jgi:hypothetical protein